MIQICMAGENIGFSEFLGVDTGLFVQCKALITVKNMFFQDGTIVRLILETDMIRLQVYLERQMEFFRTILMAVKLMAIVGEHILEQIIILVQ